jgi:hypothetical protein
MGDEASTQPGCCFPSVVRFTLTRSSTVLGLAKGRTQGRLRRRFEKCALRHGWGRSVGVHRGGGSRDSGLRLIALEAGLSCIDGRRWAVCVLGAVGCCWGPCLLTSRACLCLLSCENVCYSCVILFCNAEASLACSQRRVSLALRSSCARAPGLLRGPCALPSLMTVWAAAVDWGASG